MPTTVYIAGSALDQAMKIVCRGLPTSGDRGCMEVSGLLLGRETGNDILITSAITGAQVSTELTSKLDDDFLAFVATRLMMERKRDRIVCMFHSHPDIGIFLSQQDLQTLANFQRLYPSFIMMVIDPLKLKTYGFFTYDDETRSARPLAVVLIE